MLDFIPDVIFGGRTAQGGQILFFLAVGCFPAASAIFSLVLSQERARLCGCGISVHGIGFALLWLFIGASIAALPFLNNALLAQP